MSKRPWLDSAAYMTIADIARREDRRAWRRFQRRRRLPQFAAGYFAGLASAAVLLAAVVWG